MKDFKGKVAVVTGGGRDIGRSISIALAKEGAKVVVNYNSSRAAAKKTVEEITAMKGKAIMVKADVSTLRGLKSLKSKTEKAFGKKVHILVNNCLLYTSPSPRD